MEQINHKKGFILYLCLILPGAPNEKFDHDADALVRCV